MPRRRAKPLHILDRLDEMHATSARATYTTWGLLPGHVYQLEQCDTEQGMSDIVDDAQDVFDDVGSILRRKTDKSQPTIQPGVFRLIDIFQPTTMGRNELLALDAIEQDITRERIDKAMDFIAQLWSEESHRDISGSPRHSLEVAQKWASDLRVALESYSKETGESEDERIRRYFSDITARMVIVIQEYQTMEWFTNLQQSYQATSSMSQRGSEEEDPPPC